jgi:hypothetical protein
MVLTPIEEFHSLQRSSFKIRPSDAGRESLQNRPRYEAGGGTLSRGDCAGAL